MKTVNAHDFSRRLAQVLREVEAGERYAVVRDGREIARVLPPVPALDVVLSARRRITTKLADRSPVALRTAASVDELIAEMS